MKIIMPGVIPETNPIRATCGNCRAVFEFLPIEAKYTSDQRDGDFYTVSCPCCSKQVNRDVPSGRGPYG